MDSQQFQRRFFNRLGNQLQLRCFFDLLPDVHFWAKDEQSRFVTVNRSVLDITELAHEDQMIGQTDLAFYPRDLGEQYIAEDQRVMKSCAPIVNQAWMVPNRRGELKWYISSKIPLLGKGDKVIGTAGVMRGYEQTGAVIEPYQEMERVVKYVLSQFPERIEVAHLARIVHLSVSQFDRKFKKVFQITPQQFILRVRIHAARQALTSTDQTISQIAQHTGFYDQSYFTKQFTKQTGLTPTAYRNKYRHQIEH